ncbi:hypothetical protein E8F20_02120 [Pseudomonas sp. BN415]|uniref:hypothetical protein n=1 Tax=Pseudomonas sp. BN415 TaxID=2567889 RepID=UPI0024553DFD|nr:hypothetical protein [Pseudomonas sp. BN415]MDH4580667.1 hypothetical protein [Pseudomonas sp. BN415]
MDRLNAFLLQFENESPTSHLNRIAYANGFKTLKSLISYLKLNCTTAECIHQESELFYTLLQDAENSPHLKPSILYRRSPTILQHSPIIVNGIKVPYKLVRCVDGARCPVCLYNGWEHYIKDIRLLQYCPLHDTPYLIACPNCHRRTNWDSQLLDYCKCGYKITSAVAIQPTDATPERRILQIFENQSQEKFDLLTKTLDHFKHPFLSKSKPVNRTLLNTALAVAFNDSEALVEHLEILSSQYPQIDQILIAETLPSIRNEAIEQARSKFLNMPPSRTIRPPLDPEPTFNHEQVRLYLKLSKPKWLAALTRLSSKGLISHHDRCSATKINIIQESIQADSTHCVSESETSTMSLKDAATTLQVCKEIVRRSVQLGLIDSSKIKGKIHIDKESFKKFKDTYALSTTLARELSIPPHALMMRLKPLAIKPISGPPIDGNIMYVFLRKDVAHLTTDNLLLRSPLRTPWNQRKYFKSLPPIPPNKEGLYFDVTEVANHLQLARTTILQLCRSGLLGTIYRQSNLKILIPKATTKSFHDIYIGGRELKKSLNLPPNLTSATLQSLGIYQVTGSLVDGGKSPFFRRSHITDDIHSRLREQYQINLTGIDKKKTTYLSLSQASRRLGITRKQLDSLINQSIIRTKTPAPGLSKPQTGVSLATVSSYESWISLQTPIQSAIDKLGITRRKFHRRFTTSGFLKPYYLHGNKYIREKDLLRAEDNLERFCDCAEADQMLGVPYGYTRNHRNLLNLISVSPIEANNIRTIKLLDKAKLIDQIKTINY